MGFSKAEFVLTDYFDKNNCEAVLKDYLKLLLYSLAVQLNCFRKKIGCFYKNVT